MRRFAALIAGTAIAIAAPALADPPGGGGSGGGHDGGMGQGMGAGMGGGLGVGMNSGGFGPGGRPGDIMGRDFGTQMSTDARALRDARTTSRTDNANRPTDWRSKSQGAAHASATGIAHANMHSVIAGGTTVVAGPLTGLTVGMPVTDGSTTVGTVQRIVTSPDGIIRNVLVMSSDGSRVYPLGASSLSLSGGTLVTSSWSRSGR